MQTKLAWSFHDGMIAYFHVQYFECFVFLMSLSALPGRPWWPVGVQHVLLMAWIHFARHSGLLLSGNLQKAVSTIN